MVKLILLCSIAFLWYAGGKSPKWARRFAIPFLFSLYYLNIFVALSSFAIAQGYGNYEPGEKNSWLGNLTKDHNGWWIRAIYGAMVALAISIPIFITKQNYWLIAYVLGNSLVGYLVSKLKLKVLPCDLIVGASFASIILWR